MTGVTSQRHMKARLALFDKYDHISQLRDAPLELSQLQEVGICASEFDLNDEENFPHYFLPLTAEKLASLATQRPDVDKTVTTRESFQMSCPHDRSELTAYEVLNQILNYDGVEEGESCVLDTFRWTHGREMGRFERTLRKGERPYDYRRRWSLHDRYETGDHNYPHMIAIVYNGLTESESLVRADLLCAMGIIIDRMRWEWTQSYLVFPVLMLSFSGGRGRIIQAHFDGSIFHFKYSRWYDFMGMDQETIDLFVRWLLNDPIGDTAIVAAMDDTNPCTTGKSPSKSRAYPRRTGISVV